MPMRKTIVMLILAAFSSGVMAEWVIVTGNDKFTLYADPATRRQSGSKIKIWELSDLKTKQFVNALSLSPETYLSIRAQVEYDCKEEQLRHIFSSAHSDNMSRGEIVRTWPKSSEWQPVAPGTIAEIMWKNVCSMK